MPAKPPANLPARKRGRPPVHDRQAVILAVCQRIAQGELVKDAAEAEGVAPKTVREWALNDAELGALYARAREEQAHAMAEEAIRIADSPAETTEAVQRNKLRVDTRKWLTSKIAPKAYGEKIQAELSGELQSTELHYVILGGQKVPF